MNTAVRRTVVRRTSVAIATVATAGISTLFVGAAPANAVAESCGATGHLIAPGVCEQTFTSGAVHFTPDDQMTQLEVLLVGAGGSGSIQPATNTNGYASAGGGGAVTVTDFSGTTTALNGHVPTPGHPGTVTDGTTIATAPNGLNGEANGHGGASGNGNAGATATIEGPTPVPYGGGGGAGAAAAATPTPGTNADGGQGVVVGNIVPVGSLFTGDGNCYGGGGAAGVANVEGLANAQGVPGCGGGAPTSAAATALSAPIANSGGGGGGLNIPQTAKQVSGASGVVVIRWTAATHVTLHFSANGHGTAPAPQTVDVGTVVTKPADPTATGYEFEGWYTTPSLKTPADFSAPLTFSRTYYAKWLPALAPTGLDVSPVAPAAAVGALVLGLGLFVAAQRRRRWND
jgi:uncharacterized repeat protein (TIGR02543 family)